MRPCLFNHLRARGIHVGGEFYSVCNHIVLNKQKCFNNAFLGLLLGFKQRG